MRQGGGRLNRKHSAVSSQRSVVSGQWSVVSGQPSVVSGQPSAVSLFYSKAVRCSFATGEWLIADS
ncbi:MAG: hypothetical protein F6K26_21995 [Moorea sp. SIO2I5]|nr:hypothetical protein [Moorena sp. SIO2I5]